MRKMSEEVGTNPYARCPSCGSDQIDQTSSEDRCTIEYYHCAKCGTWYDKSKKIDNQEAVDFYQPTKKKIVDRTLRSKKTVAEIGEKLAEWVKSWGDYTLVRASRFRAVCQELVDLEDAQNTDNSVWIQGNSLSFSATINGEYISGFIEEKAYKDGKSVSAIRLNSCDSESVNRQKEIARKFFEQFFGENIVVEHKKTKVSYPEIGQILKLQQTVLNPSS